MKTTVKIIKLVNGDDIVTVLPTGDKQLPDNGPLIRLDKPLQIKYVPQMTPMGFRDYIALIRWTNYTMDKVVTIPKDKIMTIVTAGDEMKKSYIQIASTYDSLKPPARDDKKYTQEKFSDDENEELNELFDEFRDTKGTLH